LVGCVLLFFPGPIVDPLGVPAPEPAIYANLAGAALLGLALALARASQSPEEHRTVIEATMVANVLEAAVLAVWLTALNPAATATGKAVLAVVAGCLAVLGGLQAVGLRRGDAG
jgi:hypothetical protein